MPVMARVRSLAAASNMIDVDRATAAPGVRAAEARGSGGAQKCSEATLAANPRVLSLVSVAFHCCCSGRLSGI